MAVKAKAIIFTGFDTVELQSVNIADPGENEVLIEALYTVISPGTELRCLAGKQAGAVFPFIPGYSFAGRVIKRGKNTTLPEGTIVYCTGTAVSDININWGGHVSHAVQSERKVFPLPDGVNPMHGAAAHLAGIAYRGVRLGYPRPHEKVAIIGLGPIGLLSAKLHVISGAYVTAADLSPYRVSLAREEGIDAMVAGEDLLEEFNKVIPDGAEVVVDATGNSEVLPQALRLVRNKSWDEPTESVGRLIVQASYSADMCIPYQTAFEKEVKLLVPRDAQPDDIDAVLDLMKRKKLHLDDVITDLLDPKDAPDVYRDLANPVNKLMTVAFKWG